MAGVKRISKMHEIDMRYLSKFKEFNILEIYAVYIILRRVAGAISHPVPLTGYCVCA